jgi:hypothetical protein
MRALIALTFVIAACGGGGDKQTFDAKPPTPDAPVAGPDASCFMNPQTHYEIINGCTNAQSVDKNPVLPLQYPDGGLPPLPQ